MNKNSFKNIIYFILIFLIVFGNKINNIDISILSAFLGLLLTSSLKKIKINVIFIRMTIILSIIIIYILFMFIFNYKPSNYFVLRYLRAFLGLLFIPFFAQSYPIENKNKIKYLIFVLLIHSIFTIFGSFNLDFQRYISLFTGYDKTIRFFRSTGLTIGYDMSGLINILGFFLSIIYIVYNKNKLIIRLFPYIFFLSAFLTSRVNIFLIILFTFLISLYLINKNKKIYGYFLLFLFIIMLIPAIILIDITTNINLQITNLLIEIFPSIGNFVSSIETYFSNYLVENIFKQQYNFSEINNIFFGDMQNPSLDPGYTKSIYMIGIFGIILILFYYFYIIKIVKLMRKTFKKNMNYFFNDISIFIIVSVIIILFLNFKNLYFHTRYVDQIILICLGILMGEKNKKGMIK
jgi:hypothetical protein